MIADLVFVIVIVALGLPGLIAVAFGDASVGVREGGQNAQPHEVTPRRMPRKGWTAAWKWSSARRH